MSRQPSLKNLWPGKHLGDYAPNPFPFRTAPAISIRTAGLLS